jgi:hypothetical protein
MISKADKILLIFALLAGIVIEVNGQTDSVRTIVLSMLRRLNPLSPLRAGR